MYEIQFFKKMGGTGRIYVWGADLEMARIYIEEHEHNIFRINECSAFEWLFWAYIREPEKRFKKWWTKG